MNRRRLITIITAIVLTLLGTWIIVVYVNNAEERAVGGQELTNVLVPTEEIPAGTVAGDMEGLVEVRSIPADLRPDDALTELAEVRGQVTTASLLPGEPLRAGRFADEAEAGAPGAAAVEEGHQVVTIALESQRALGGSLRRGALVGVLVSLDEGSLPDGETGTTAGTTTDEEGGGPTTGFVLDEVPVVDVEGGEGGMMVSLSVDKSAAGQIVFGAEHGRIWLTEQNEDTNIGGGQVRTRDNIYPSTD